MINMVADWTPIHHIKNIKLGMEIRACLDGRSPIYSNNGGLHWFKAIVKDIKMEDGHYSVFTERGDTRSRWYISLSPETYKYCLMPNTDWD